MVLERLKLCSSRLNVSSFNPCEGFGGFGTPAPEFKARLDGIVSIPVRDLVVLERLDSDHAGIQAAGFNPCEGFGGFGTSPVFLAPLLL